MKQTKEHIRKRINKVFSTRKCKNKNCNKIFKTQKWNEKTHSLCKACRMKRWREKLKLTLINEFGGKCSICGYSKCLRALTFHHKDPSIKERNLSRLFCGLEKSRKEAKKCILVCMNCHMEIHSKEHEIRL